MFRENYSAKYSIIIDAAVKYPHAAYYFCKKLKINYSKHLTFENIKLPSDIHFKSFSKNYTGFKDLNFQKKVEALIAPYKIQDITGTLDPILNTRYSAIFGNNKDIIDLYVYVGSFESTDYEIKTILQKLRLCQAYENDIIQHPYGHYSIEYIQSIYGTTDISLEQYESIRKNLEPLNKYVEEKEAGYRSLRKEMPLAVDEFEKLYPEVPHSEYPQYRDKIHEVGIKCKYAIYDKVQNGLTSKLSTSLSNVPNWITIKDDLNIQITDFDESKKNVNVCGITCFNRYLYEGSIQSTSNIPLYKNKYPFCAEMFFDPEKELDRAYILRILAEVLPHIIECYQSKFVELTIVISEDFEQLDITNNALLEIIKQAHIKTTHISLISEYLFGYQYENHRPHLFLSLYETSVSIKKKMRELTRANLLFSLCTICNILDYDELLNMHDSRVIQDKTKKTAHISKLQEQYPHGFIDVCNEHNIVRLAYLEHYETLCSHEYDMRVREEKYKQDIIIRKAKAIIMQYPNAAKDDGYCKESTLSYHQTTSIFNKEAKWKEIETFYYNRCSVFATDHSICGCPHKFFYKYYPDSRFPNHSLSEEDRRNRVVIWDFKDGKPYATRLMINLVSEYLNSIEALKQISQNIVFVCAPASNRYSYENRFSDFSKQICSILGYTNGTKHIDITSYSTPKHRGGSGDVEYNLDENIFQDHYIIIFDDLVTSGATITSFSNRIKAAKGRVIAIISAGQTV